MKGMMRVLGLTALCLIAAFVLSEDGCAYLHTQGRDIVDSNGQKVLLRGIGLGGWLVPEGYQLHIPGFGSPSSIRGQIEALIGTEDAEEFYQRYIANYVAEVDMQQMAAWGFNSIRLPFNYRLLTPEDQPGVYLEEGFEILDQTLDWCRDNNLYLILDMHCAPGGQNNGNISDSDGILARLWTNPINQDRTVAIWRKIAERYAGEEWIGGYDLINEPVLPDGYTNSDLRQFYIRLVQAIREVDQDHIVFIEGNWYATDFSYLTPPFDSNLVYSFHKYWNENTPASISNYLSIRSQHNVPLWMGESGENSNPWFSDCVHLLEGQEIGWCWWTHKKIETLTSPYSSPIGPMYQRVLDYWSGSAGKPTAEYARIALYGMADQLRIDRCEFRPDVVEALLRTDFNISPIPYKDHHIPGLVRCADYDFGDVGIAYRDMDYENVHGLGSGEVWNQGGLYRNDGVDIEACDDLSYATYDVGWIEAGEWLSYTVQVDTTGVYDMILRTSSPEGKGKVWIFWDGQPLADVVSIPNTGGWQQWQDVSLSDISLNAGEHKLKVTCVTAGYNINSIRFNLKSSVLRGDVTGDGGIDVIDVVSVANIILGLVDPTPAQLYAADCNGDVTVNVLDMLGIVNVILELGTCQP